MPYLSSIEDFAKAAELLYLADPMKVRFVMKYLNNEGKLYLKITDDQVVIQYLSEYAQDIKKIEKLTSQLMRHMASKESSK